MAPNQQRSTKAPNVVAAELKELRQGTSTTSPYGTSKNAPAAAASSKKNFQPHHSQSVPKPENLVRGSGRQQACDTPITTVMLRNIPNKYTQGKLLQELDECGFAGTYNFFYLPMDVHNRSNVGYAFINFEEACGAERFRQVFSQHCFQRFHSRKVGTVCVAHVQGLDQNLRHFENRAVTQAKNDQYRPVVLKGKQRIDFEQALAEAKAKLEPSTAATTPPNELSEVHDAAMHPQSAGGSSDEAAHGARGGLEAAIRQLLAASSSPASAPLPAPGAPATSRREPEDVAQLLSLRSRLETRLHECLEAETAPARQVSGDLSMSAQAPEVPPMTRFGLPKTCMAAPPGLEGPALQPAYVDISSHRGQTPVAKPFKAGLISSGKDPLEASVTNERNPSTPRTNGVILGMSLNNWVTECDQWRTL